MATKTNHAKQKPTQNIRKKCSPLPRKMPDAPPTRRDVARVITKGLLKRLMDKKLIIFLKISEFFHKFQFSLDSNNILCPKLNSTYKWYTAALFQSDQEAGIRWLKIFSIQSF